MTKRVNANRGHQDKQGTAPKSVTPQSTTPADSTSQFMGSPPIKELLSLQRTLGNHSVQRMFSNRNKTIQRYTQVDAASYAATPSAAPEAGPMFATQGTDPTISPGLEIHYPGATFSKPPLLVADDSTMAVHDTPDEAREFYATAKVVADSNTRLNEVGSPIQLDGGSSGNAITVSGKTLTKVRPKKADNKAALTANEYADFVFHRCVFVAHRIMGNANPTGLGSEVVLNDKDGGKAKAQVKETANNAPYADRMAKHLVDTADGGTSEGAVTALQGKDPDAPVGEQYGRALGSGALDERSKALGVNKHARAEVGEGYVSVPISAGPGKDKEDFSKLQLGDKPKKLADDQLLWSYHFAAVAANSENHADHVTLENYNRGIEIKDQLNKLATKLETDYADLIKTLVFAPNLSKEDRTKMILAAVYQQAGEKKAEAEAHAKSAINLSAGTMWYFKMFGSKAGQSFHEAQAATDFFVNPLTMVVRPPRKTSPVDVLFKEATATPIQEDVNKLLMPGTINGIKKDLETQSDRKLKIVGYANKKSFGRSNAALAGLRATAIKQLLVTNGVDPARIELVNGGDSTDLPLINGKKQKASNRRAQIFIE